jgi:hypothetical protein
MSDEVLIRRASFLQTTDILVANSLLDGIEHDGVSCVSDRLISIRGTFYGKKMVFISAYAPTMLKTFEEKGKFYHDLGVLVTSFPKDYIVVIGGDWNARIGSKIEGDTDFMRGGY